ncbi:outer membrane protein assembly factor BamE [Pinisolibacter aquiterrae]|uniref:outer membrane protein assembly factor BamE n=1 Tax=Pinisolibacter aquiterrae TaxID=2815579 RepID=UPI001C3DFE50|nr:outer membrane protein assembly factor BamE [Pinisolibacter aquiterrae]MBV5264127.1 outer membrane protein assembly factor BamE [Pinisolibacter aquiterrae]MCC8233779.1 outer membrane protein assembly factor BamE [Pinisolibacter aquiterrae]
MNRRSSRAASLRGATLAVALAALTGTALGLGGCTEVYDHGYVAPDNALEQIQVGASREQVLLVLGSPSTTATLGGEAFYYISQHSTRSVAFLNQSVVEQKVLVIYFDEKGQVKEIGNYGLQDGKVFDFISRKTKTTGSDYGLLSQILKATPANPLTGGN